MDRKPLIGVSICAIIVLISGITVSSGYPIAETQSKNIYHFQSIFHLQFSITICWNANQTETPILSGETREINLEIIYAINRGPYGRLILKLLEGKTFPIQLSLEDKPDWCDAMITSQNMTGFISPDETEIQYSSLLIHLKENAPGNYTIGTIKMRGTIKDMKGPFNILTLIDGFEQQVSLVFMTGP